MRASRATFNDILRQVKDDEWRGGGPGVTYYLNKDYIFHIALFMGNSSVYNNYKVKSPYYPPRILTIAQCHAGVFVLFANNFCSNAC